MGRDSCREASGCSDRLCRAPWPVGGAATLIGAAPPALQTAAGSARASSFSGGAERQLDRLRVRALALARHDEVEVPVLVHLEIELDRSFLEDEPRLVASSVRDAVADCPHCREKLRCDLVIAEGHCIRSSWLQLDLDRLRIR